MENCNQTSTDFILLGLFPSSRFGLFLFILIVLIFLLALFGNLSMILLIFLNIHLHKPMYFLLSQLSLIDLNYISTIVPKMAYNYLFGNKSISFIGCGVQSFFFLTLAGAEALLLASMAYDRYVDICFPLHYWGWCTGTTQRDGMGREEGGGFRMGNTCIPVADSF